jgi:hypothetical protein
MMTHPRRQDMQYSYMYTQHAPLSHQPPAARARASLTMASRARPCPRAPSRRPSRRSRATCACVSSRRSPRCRTRGSAGRSRSCRSPRTTCARGGWVSRRGGREGETHPPPPKHIHTPLTRLQFSVTVHTHQPLRPPTTRYCRRTMTVPVPDDLDLGRAARTAVVALGRAQQPVREEPAALLGRARRLEAGYARVERHACAWVRVGGVVGLWTVGASACAERRMREGREDVCDTKQNRWVHGCARSRKWRLAVQEKKDGRTVGYGRT